MRFVFPYRLEKLRIFECYSGHTWTFSFCFCAESEIFLRWVLLQCNYSNRKTRHSGKTSLKWTITWIGCVTLCLLTGVAQFDQPLHRRRCSRPAHDIVRTTTTIRSRDSAWILVRCSEHGESLQPVTLQHDALPVVVDGARERRERVEQIGAVAINVRAACRTGEHRHVHVLC